MKNLTSLPGILIFSMLFARCSTDGTTETPPAPENLTPSKMSVTYTPQQANFTQKTVKYFAENLIVADSTFNNSGQLTGRSVFTYSPTSRTEFNYDGTGLLINKVIHNYDNLHRLTSVDTYNPSNQIIYSRSFAYQNENIMATTTYNGVSTLAYHYKTNADGLIYYEEDMANNNYVRTLDYVGDKPVLLHYPAGLGTASYTYHTQMKPLDLQNNPIEVNNAALSSLTMEHVHFSCNYYLKQIYFSQIDLTLNRTFLFNADNYETYLKITTTGANGTQNSSETFTFYNL